MFGISNSNNSSGQPDDTSAPTVPDANGFPEIPHKSQMPSMPMDDSLPTAPPMPVAAPTPSTYNPPTAPTLATSPQQATDQPASDLIQLKQQALSQLAPLVDHLDQTPEEKFKTTMMMLQASDNQALVQEAYAAANAIQDEKIRAQALLDVVNEINYFTQHDAPTA